MKTKQIHLLWQGLHELDAILEMTGPTDRGVYQVCGSLPVYGWDALGYSERHRINLSPTGSEGV